MKSFYTHLTGTSLAESSYKTALKVVSVATLLSFLAWSSFRIYRHLSSRSISSPPTPQPPASQGQDNNNTTTSPPPSSSPGMEQKDSLEERSQKDSSPYHTPSSSPNTPLFETPEESDDLSLTLTPEESERLTQKLLEIEKQEKPSPLDKFRKELPGLHFTCGYQENGKHCEKTFADYLLKTLLREDEILECTVDENKQFKLTYLQPKNIQLRQLPQPAWDKMSWLLKRMIQGLLNIAPDIQIAACLEGQVIQDAKGTKIVFKENGVFLAPNSLKYTAYLKCIWVVNDPTQNENKRLIIEAEHNSSYLEKVGPIDHQLFAETLAMNFFPQRDT